MKDFPNGVKETFLKELHVPCDSQEEREVYFCQAEQELLKISSRSGAKFDHFRTDKKLMRTLNKYKKHHGKNCEPDSEVQVPLHDFLKNLLRCVKNAYSKPNTDFVQFFCEATEKSFSMKGIPVYHSEMILLGDDELDMATKNVPVKETEGKPVDELVTAMKNVPKVTEGKNIFLKDKIRDTTLPAESVQDKAMKIVPKVTEGKNTSLKDEIRYTTLSAESDDEQDKAVEDVPKVTEEAKILVEDKICNKTLKGKPDDELVTAMKNVPKETEGGEIALEDAKNDFTPVKRIHKTLLGELIDELNIAMKDFPNGLIRD
ncbi:interleukin 4 13A [Labeo rohita]|uniref:Interleukin 4 13A n=1 Tax=Labeo rohita TaxID=84645 RepID=A0A498MDI4_LABRO|nr:interleukin 4 13A [Labeo rohita]